MVKMFEDLYSDLPYPINCFLNQVSDYIIINLDKKLNIIGFNKNFLDITQLEKEEIIKLKLNEVFTGETIGYSELKKIKNYKRFELSLTKKISTSYSYLNFTCYIFSLKEDGFYLFGQKNNLKQEDVINKISKLNNQLSNATRELNKKNFHLQEANKKIKELARTDELTGLSNYRHFIEYTDRVISYSQRHLFPLSLIICDFDKFKNINDSYGHDVGDEVLKAFSQLLIAESRKGDMAARIGGEEFAIVLNGASLENGINYAERIRKKTVNLEVPSLPQKLTVSMGITELRNSDDYNTFFKRADLALYKAKENGRNQVCSQ
ncbi:diguanylate cyclase (GGDEF) domain-containing protein [Halanaerobium congolense]|jgi:diguanylate cyclase (GGDEF)-like protein|uniref:Diguanylate cyclase (GGDEF) domain-containing protein n=1 Tax=Halanaerobium congolense TaxID=54121 RepID=A0A1G8QM13_9FIRM|nr:GGDEF domain-containing protein [Halanaerobium congolense]PUU89424.1 MAG: diguanylate cyclase [Halanaerobium sp.]SDJ05829.1 diguanylate cyclase (GGDEF) domain-containing protein [Halanaerobium congolense]SET43554.1 diguanylate cyclase (GGDEF) domain-containing protein [Halanaerobium congolense]